MPTSPICIDAGIVVRLVLFPNDGAVQSLWKTWIGGRQKIIAPALLYYEVVDVLYQYQKQGELTAEMATTAVSVALALPVEIHSDSDLHGASLDVARRYGLPATYDAHYVALAQSYGAVLWTTDQRLVNRCQQDWVRLVE